MNFYKKLNLPQTLIKNENEFKETLSNTAFENPSYAIFTKDILSDELINAIESVVKIKHVVVFHYNRAPMDVDEETRIIHSDAYYDDSTNSWRDIYCGLNFELNPTTNSISWFDIKDSAKLYPTNITNDTVSKLTGVHYGERNVQGKRNFVKLDETPLDNKTVTLIRTDIPHWTVWYGTEKRYGISIRIDESNISSWLDVLEIFKPLYK